MPRNWKTFGALAVAGCCATIGLTTGTAEAQTQIKTSNVTELGSYNDSGRTGNYQFVANNWDSRYQRYQQSFVWVSGQDGGKDMAHCLRGNGGANWYESSIVARNGTNSSHYDCTNNGTYNRGFDQVGVDLSNW
ncbi:hypothetical protein ACIQ9Q_19420 [Streptomyces sp. NPDC094438]|uniref:hypothetical protein n=1 Tax=Streptomyces sp. NPDC094438 TaxID=3366061 RepID=UPI00381025D1